MPKCRNIHPYGECNSECRGGAKRRVDVTEFERAQMQYKARVTKEEEIRAIMVEDINRGPRMMRVMGRWVVSEFTKVDEND